jgi:7,8-dihydropterin-6-yl-methyl-4-(beta-D-ribofuranosyl)aminobenzene 5'-phosphate synthase
LHEENIVLVVGGFHLGWAQTGEIEQIIRALQGLGVRYVAPTHCSGDKARALFAKHFGAHYLEVGVGTTISLADLK